jgi:hypothetical protein
MLRPTYYFLSKFTVPALILLLCYAASRIRLTDSDFPLLVMIQKEWLQLYPKAFASSWKSGSSRPG